MIDRPPASRNARALVWGSMACLVVAMIAAIILAFVVLAWLTTHPPARPRSVASHRSTGGMYGPPRPAPRPMEASSSPIVRREKWADLDTSRLESKPGPFDPPPTTIRTEPDSAGDTSTYRYQGGYHWYWIPSRNAWLYNVDREAGRIDAERLNSGSRP